MVARSPRQLQGEVAPPPPNQSPWDGETLDNNDELGVTPPPTELGHLGAFEFFRTLPQVEALAWLKEYRKVGLTAMKAHELTDQITNWLIARHKQGESPERLKIALSNVLDKPWRAWPHEDQPATPSVLTSESKTPEATDATTKPKRNKPRGPKPAIVAEPPEIQIKPDLAKETRDRHVESAVLDIVARFNRLNHEPMAVEVAVKIQGVDRKIVIAILHRLAREGKVIKRVVGRMKTGLPIERFVPVPEFEGLYVAGEIWSVHQLANDRSRNRLGIPRRTLQYRIYDNGWSARVACATPTYGTPLHLGQ